ncbi:hypothetical protein [Brevundimonas nasdae]|uniref:hypothetical protein n=1 Tax=Brevundimonas nasdae TaxID=172043 RepID=UPI003F6926BE
MTAVPIDHSHRRRRPEPEGRRTFSPVRRNSQPAGGENWRPISWKEGRRMLLALRIHAEKQRRKGERTGCKPRDKADPGGISFGAIRLAEILVGIATKRDGRLEPSVKWLAKALNVPLKSIHAWKAQLKRHGFLDWRRRWVFTGREGPRGEQVQQTSNAYWMKAPVEALQAADKVLAPRKPEEDDEARWAAMPPEMQASLRAMKASAARRSERGSQAGRISRS